MPIIHRRSKPVKGSVAALAVSLEGEVLEVAGVLVLLVVGVVSLPVSFDGDVLALGVVGVLVVGVVPVLGVVGVVGVVVVFSSGFFS
jgi:hypothetical protein